MICVNGDPPIPDLHVFIGHGTPVFKASIPLGGDLHGLIPEIAKLGVQKPAQEQKESWNQEKTAHNG
jgi:hypothetical protein